MYDLLSHHTPLGPTESFDIRFNVVEDGNLEQYLVQAFGNGSVKILQRGPTETMGSSRPVWERLPPGAGLGKRPAARGGNRWACAVGGKGRPILPSQSDIQSA